jgi:hypothetical protein
MKRSKELVNCETDAQLAHDASLKALRKFVRQDYQMLTFSQQIGARPPTYVSESALGKGSLKTVFAGKKSLAVRSTLLTVRSTSLFHPAFLDASFRLIVPHFINYELPIASC